MRYENTPQLSGWLSKDFPLLSAMPGFTLDDAEYEKHLASLGSRPASERQDAAAFRCLTHGITKNRPVVNPSVAAIAIGEENDSVLEEIISTRKLLKWGLIAILATLWAIFGAIEAHAQGNQNVAVVVAACGTPPTNIPAASAGSPNRVYLTVDVNGQICINGTITGGNAAASATGAAVPANADYIGVNVGGTLRGATATNTSGSVFAIDTNCVAGCAGGTNDVDDASIATGQTTGINLPLNYVFDGAVWRRLTTSAAGSGLSTGLLTVQGNASGTPIPVSGTVSVTGVAGTEYVQDAPLTVGTTQGGMAMGRASAAAPTTVSADNDAVLPWYTRSGAQVSELAIGGTFVPSGHGTASNGIRVELPTDGTGRMATVDTVTTVGAVTSITNSLPSGTNGIGKLTANSGVIIGDVNIVSNIPGTGATNLGKAEDSVAGSGDTGVAILGVIQATLTAPAADGDYTVPKLNANGALWVQNTLVDAAENAAVATNPVPIGGVYRSSPVTLDAGDVGYPLLDVNGRLIVNCNMGCSGGTQYTQDAALTIASSIVTLSGGRASAAVPTGVSADDDAVIAWYLRSGAQATQPTFGGVLGVAGNGASGTGVQRVTIANDSTGILALTTGSAQIGHLEANQSVNVAQINGVTTLMGNGASGTGAQRVTLANDSTGVLATVSTVTSISQLGGVALPIEDAAETPAGVGIYAMGVRRDTPASSAGNTGDNTMAAYSANGGIWNAAIAETAGGVTMYNVEPGASDNHANIKNGAGQVYSVHAFSKDTVANYIRLYNAATGFNGCNSATNLVWSGIIPGASTGAGFVWEVPTGIPFSTGISICVTGAYGQTSTTSATASVMEVNVGYK